MYIELHMIQNFVPSVLNRDDLNNPKDCEFGGYRRARISSQCIKRAIREHPLFEETTQVNNGIRTRYLTTLIRDPLLKAEKTEEEAKALATSFAKKYVKKLDDKTKKTNVLVFISPAEVKDAVEALLKEDKDIGDIVDDLIKKYEKITSAPDIALFGRMLAQRPDTNIEAACQVAHAISTHEIRKMETDFFTAVDDLKPDDTSGAGMMEYADFNSACYYRYARIDWRQLRDNLQGDVNLARRTVKGFLRAGVAAVPTGKKNSHAHFNPPAFLLAVVREDGMGWNLANAFATPVQPSAKENRNLITGSVAALEREWDLYKNAFGGKTLRRVAALPLHNGLSLEKEKLAKYQVPDLEKWVDAVLDELPQE